MSMLTIGVDDAGRGPIIGPMILAGVLINEEQEKILKKEGAKDSKALLHNERIRIAKEIKENCMDYKIVRAYPEEIDEFVKSGKNLNTLEAIKTAEIINYLNKGKESIKVIVDCPSVNTRAWKSTLMKYLKKPDNLAVFCEHKADVNHISASAGSILAKVDREDEVKKIKKEYGEIGSGYPSDPATIKFLKENGKKLVSSGIFRKSWATWKKLFAEAKQTTLKL